LREHDAKTVYFITSFLTGMTVSIVFSANQLYRIQTVGLDPLQLVLVGTTLEITAFIFEIPTGIVADVYSRRLSVILGSFLFGIGFLVEGSIPLFGVILLAQIIWGIAWTFISGAHSAWITDEVGVENVGPIFIRFSQLHQLGNLLGIPIFIILGNISYRLPILVGGVIFLLIGTYRLLAMPETGFSRIPKEERDDWKEMVATFKAGLHLTKIKPILMTFAIIALFVGMYGEGYDRLSEAHLLEQFRFPTLPWGGDPIVSWFAIIRVVGLIAALSGNEIIKRRINTEDTKQIPNWLQYFYAIISIGLFIFAWSKNFYLAISATLLIDTTRSMTKPLIDTWVNKHIRSKVRATILSMTSQVDACGQIVGGPLVGFIGNLRSIRAAISTSAILIIPVIPLYYRIKQQSKQGKNKQFDLLR